MPVRKPQDAPAKRPAHRPEFAPTKEQRKTVQIMIAGGIQQAAIAGALGISEPTLRKHFREEIDNAEALINAKVVRAHLERIEAGEMPAIKWWEQARMGWSEKVIVDDNRAPAPLRVTVKLVGAPAPAPVTLEHEGCDRPGYDAARRRVHLVG